MIKKFNKASVGLFLAALSMAAIAAQDGINLKRAPKVGESIKFRLKADVEIAGTDATFTALVTEKITKVETNGNYSIESTQSEGKISFGGQEMDAPNQTQTMTYKATGEVIEIKAETQDSSVYRMANLQAFVVPDKPLKVGEEWTTEIKKDEKTGAVAGKGTFKVEAQEKSGAYDTYKVKFSVKESDGGDAAASVNGTVWISVKDGTLVKFDGAWKNAPFPGAPGPINAKFVLSREG